MLAQFFFFLPCFSILNSRISTHLKFFFFPLSLNQMVENERKNGLKRALKTYSHLPHAKALWMNFFPENPICYAIKLSRSRRTQDPSRSSAFFSWTCPSSVWVSFKLFLFLQSRSNCPKTSQDSLFNLAEIDPEIIWELNFEPFCLSFRSGSPFDWPGFSS